MRLALFIMTLVSVALLFLLTQASANTDFFARHYAWLVGLNVVLGLAWFGDQRPAFPYGEIIATRFSGTAEFRLMLMLAITQR